MDEKERLDKCLKLDSMLNSISWAEHADIFMELGLDVPYDLHACTCSSCGKSFMADKEVQLCKECIEAIEYYT